MSKTFYTERDIVDLFKRGITSLEVREDVVLTEMAYEKAGSLGIKLVSDKPDNPPCAPIRPYIAKVQQPAIGGAPSVPRAAPRSPAEFNPQLGSAEAPDLQLRIREAVIARLGNQVDLNILDVIIRRVLTSTGVK